MKLLYFAWVRERVGRQEEEIRTPDGVSTVGDLVDWLRTRGPEYERAFEAGRTIRAAIDKRHARHDATIAGASEIAFFPPMTAAERPVVTVRLQQETFDLGAEVARLTEGRADVGAVVTFSGVCRDRADSGAKLVALTLEHYPGMVEDELGRIETAARRRWPIADLLVIHRHGRILPGEPIVLVVALSPHRSAAFEAASYVMDFLKTAAPFWKREETEDGGNWVAAKASDDDAAKRWTTG